MATSLPHRVRPNSESGVLRPIFRTSIVFLAAAFAIASAALAAGAHARLRQPVAQSQPAAAAKMAFQVASVKQDNAPPSRATQHTNIPLDPLDAFAPTGGLFSASNFPLLQYMAFAYKLTPGQIQSVQSQLPKWATTDRYDIIARASGNPTKDEFRQMTQALLADRFKLNIHYETRESLALGLVLAKPGKLGPQLHPHPEDSPCSTAPASTDNVYESADTVAGGFPRICGTVVRLPAKIPGQLRGGGRNLPLSTFAALIDTPQLTGIDRPVFDKTGLKGKYDLVIEWTPQPTGPLPPGLDLQLDNTGPSFQEALKNQLGLKLVSLTGPVDFVVIDRVEEPSPN